MIKREIVNDQNFIFLQSGIFPEEYKMLSNALFYPSYFVDVIKPWKNSKSHANSRVDNFNIDQYPIVEYWEMVPDSIRNFGKPYSNFPCNIAVSSFGRIYDFSRKETVPVYLRKDGYLGVFNMALHRIILYTFNPIDNFLSMTVDHKNMVTVDNCLWNLQWLNVYDNIQRSIELGNRTNPYFQKGCKNIRSTMDEYHAELCCRALLTHNYSYDQIAFALGISPRQVKHIRDMDCHIDICEKYNMKNNNFDYRSISKTNIDHVLPLYDVNHR